MTDTETAASLVVTAKAMRSSASRGRGGKKGCGGWEGCGGWMAGSARWAWPAAADPARPISQRIWLYRSPCRPWMGLQAHDAHRCSTPSTQSRRPQPWQCTRWHRSGHSRHTQGSHGVGSQPQARGLRSGGDGGSRAGREVQGSGQVKRTSKSQACGYTCSEWPPRPAAWP